jgi:hypothetical protein
MLCENCGKNQDDSEYDIEIDECPDCGSFLCDDCAGWTVVLDKSICAECASNYIPAIDGFADDIICSRGSSGIQTNVPRRIVRHSPTGWGWGYGGSGPADFALNILSIFIGQAEAEIYYQDFKFEVVAKIPHEGGTIKREDILKWIEDKRKEKL